MRLIDADTLLGKAIEEKRFVFLHKDMMNHELVIETAYQDLAEFISSAPTIEAEPVRHGRLKHIFTYPRSMSSDCEVICMECGYSKSRVDGEIIRYCQYCGAKMDSEG